MSAEYQTVTDAGEEDFTAAVLFRDCYRQFVDLEYHELLDFYYTQIVPGMNRRRGRKLSSTDVVRKVYECGGGRRPGEALELARDIAKTGYEPTPEFLGEVADMTYYCAQPSCPPEFRNSMSLHVPGMNPVVSLRLCCAKYYGRLVYGDESTIKVVETGAFAMLWGELQTRGVTLIYKNAPEIDYYRMWLVGEPPGWRRRKVRDFLRRFSP